MENIAFDCHKHYTLASVEIMDGRLVREERISHARGNVVNFPSKCQCGSAVAVEMIGNWYWIMDEIEQVDMQPMLMHGRSLPE